jgi:hypothetical protein
MIPFSLFFIPRLFSFYLNPLTLYLFGIDLDDLFSMFVHADRAIR